MPSICHDCDCSVGEKHTSGCDVEECPKCHKQLITCKCPDPKEEERIPYGQETRAKFHK